MKSPCKYNANTTIVREFIQHINATITIPELHTIEPLTTKDKGLMALTQQYSNNKQDLRKINNCRLYLQVHTLAEITDTDGIRILPEAFTGSHCGNPTQPELWKYSKSTLRWPIQPKPPATAWKKWQYFLRQLTKENLILKKPIGTINRSKATLRAWYITQIDPTYPMASTVSNHKP
jgi:hypothetical protein